MNNLIGEDIDHLDEIYNNQDYLLYSYGKKNTKPGRKMGHFTKQIR